MSKKRRRDSNCGGDDKDKIKSNEPGLKKRKVETKLNEENELNKDLILREMLHQRSKIIHSPKDHILLFGEGDFSFSASLSRLGFCNLVATTDENYNGITKKYYNAKFNIEICKRMKNKIVCNIDINKINENDYFKDKLFDKIIFNFPHTGVNNYEYKKSIPSNQLLLRSIFESSSKLLKNNGELHIALKSQPIYNSWDIQKQCKNVNNDIKLKKRIKFKPESYFGYQHKTTLNDQTVESNQSFLWIFGKYVNGITTDWKPITVNAGIKFYVGMYKCGICNESYNSPKRYKMHMESRKHTEKAQSNVDHDTKNKNKKKKKKKKTKITASGKKRF